MWGQDTHAERPASEETSFEDIMLAQLRATPWLLTSLIVHVMLALVLSMLATRSIRRVEVLPIESAAVPRELEEVEQTEILEDENAEVKPQESPSEETAPEHEAPEAEGETSDEPEADPEEEKKDSEHPFEALFQGDVVGIGAGGGAGEVFGQRPPGGIPGTKHPGGSPARAAVGAGLTWLADHQSRDGRWDCDGFMANGDPGKGPLCDGPGSALNDVGVSGLALLAFLGAGHTHRDGAFKDTVRLGLRWLKSRQDAEGCFGSRGDPHFTYGHAIAALAMAEAYGMTKSGIWRAPAQRGIDFCMRSQNPYKAWRYGETPGDNDVSVSGWMVMALKSGKLASLTVNDTALRWARDFVKEMTDEKTGRTGYMKNGSRPVRAEGRLDQFPAEESESLTAVGMLIRIFSGEDPKTSEMLKAGAELLSKRLPVWDPRSGRVDMYYWYYGSLAMFQMGGPEWAAWNKRMKAAVVDSQRKDGNFRGSWDPIGPWGDDGGRVYATALMTMCLEVYYRYGRVFGTR